MTQQLRNRLPIRLFRGWVAGSLLVIGTGVCSRAIAMESHLPDPAVIRFCVNQLLYTQTFNDGKPSGDRTIMTPNAAAIACRGIQSRPESREIRRCVNGLLYENTFSDGTPTGPRTILEPEAAAQACSRCPTTNL
jgi:hypothetical protein